jgi:hypothetical protein
MRRERELGYAVIVTGTVHAECLGSGNAAEGVADPGVTGIRVTAIYISAGNRVGETAVFALKVALPSGKLPGKLRPSGPM